MTAPEGKPCQSWHPTILVLNTEDVVVAGLQEGTDHRPPVQLAASRNTVLPPPVPDDPLTSAGKIIIQSQ